jgi:hypothetical protein
MEASPTTRMGWHEYYVDLFNKTDGKRGEHLANWFLLLHLAFDEQPVEVPKQTRKEKAQSLWFKTCTAETELERKDSALELVRLKGTAKVSWKTLGLQKDVVNSFIETLLG